MDYIQDTIKDQAVDMDAADDNQNVDNQDQQIEEEKKNPKVDSLTAEQKAKFQETFNQFDISGDGTISTGEFRAVME